MGRIEMLQCIYFKFKTVRNFLCAMNIQFLYGWTGSSTVRQPKYPVGLQFCSYIVQFQREYNILLIQHSRAQVFNPGKKSFMGRNLFCKELDFFISVCLAFISEQLIKEIYLHLIYESWFHDLNNNLIFSRVFIYFFQKL